MSQIKDLTGIRVVICDVYGTLLQVGPPSRVAATVWHTLLPEFAGKEFIPMSLDEFNARCTALITAKNELRRRAGEPFPEVDWLDIATAVLQMPRTKAANVAVLHAHCTRRCKAMPGSLETIAALRAAGIKCSLASNAQFYTSNELGNAGFRRKDFVWSLRFFSSDFGFAKPSPHVYAYLKDRLRVLRIAPHETLMVGDSLENDIIPATACGWHTWHIGPQTWQELLPLVPPPLPVPEKRAPKKRSSKSK